MTRVNKKKKTLILRVKLYMVTSTGFEPVNAAVKGRCVKPLHQLAKKMALDVGLGPTTCRLTAGCSTTELSRIKYCFRGQKMIWEKNIARFNNTVILAQSKMFVNTFI